MNSSKYRFTLDMHTAQSQESLPVVLNDTARILYISLSDGGKTYHIADGCLAAIRINRPTDTYIEHFCPIEDNTNIVYDFAQTEHTAIVEGLHECEVTLYGLDGGVITTARFNMIVSARVVDSDNVEITDENWTMLDSIAVEEARRQEAFKTAMSDTEEASKRANAIAEELEQAKSNGEFKGEKGDVGPRGEKGDVGAAGVFVGPEVPTEDQPLWVDTDDSGTIKYQDPETGEWKSANGNSSGGGDTAVVPDSLPNPYPLTVDGIEYDGSKAVKVFTGEGKSVLAYGAKGDGSTDDTAAFQTALAENRVVFVPEGTYILSDTLTIGANCCLELSQSTVLKFTQTDKNCISMLRLASLKGNHATIFVPYTFSANVINCDTGDDEAALDASNLANSNNVAVPPFTRWDPQWKMSRYVTDINICKPDSRGFHYSKNGDCYGTAVYLHCNIEDYVSFMWGVTMSGVRIAGGFNYGIRIHNIGETASSWNHDMRIEAVIDACKIGVSVENCRYARLAVTIQPRRAYSDSNIYKAYAEHGIKLVDSRGIDLSSSRVWDWNEVNTLWTEGGEYQHLAMYGECMGLILDDYLYYAQSSSDIRDLIYTDTASNLEKMTVLQEPVTRWFKPIDGLPHFHDGLNDKRIALEEDFETYFEVDVIKGFTDVLPTAIDTDGSIYNGIGYKKGRYATVDGTEYDSAYYVLTGFIPCTKGSTINAGGLSFAVGDDNCRIRFYDKDFNPIYYTAADGKEYALLLNRSNLLSGGSAYLGTHEATDDGFKIVVGTGAPHNTTAYARLTVYRTQWGKRPMIAVDEEIEYTVDGFLADGINVKGESVVLTSPSGYSFKITVSDDGVLSAERSVNDV